MKQINKVFIIALFIILFSCLISINYCYAENENQEEEQEISIEEIVKNLEQENNEENQSSGEFEEQNIDEAKLNIEENNVLEPSVNNENLNEEKQDIKTTPSDLELQESLLASNVMSPFLDSISVKAKVIEVR